MIHETRMKEYIQENEMILTEEMFNSALKRLGAKHAKKYKYILKAGDSYSCALFSLMKSVWENEKIPSLWKQTQIVQLYKGKGNSNELCNYRHIHTKADTRKVFGEILTHEIKVKVSENVSKFQIGAIPGHRPQEHLFSIKSVISLYKSQGKGLILCLYDISKYFDKENLRDCMGELYDYNVRGKLYRLVFELNKETKIRVKTPVGLTEYEEVGEGLGQGTNEGAISSTVNLDGGIRKKFEDSTKEVEYAGLKLKPCLFQDDIARLAPDLDSVREGNRRVEEMAESKLLDFNLDKSNMIIIGSKKFRRKIRDELQKSPIMFCGQKMTVSESDKYLGDYMSSSLSESIFTTVNKRKGLVKRLISEIKIVVQDIKSESVGSLHVGIEIWKMAVVPFLFNNSECWVEIPKKALSLLNHLQNNFFVSLFGTSKGCPNPIFYWDSGILTVENFLILKKLSFYHHLLTLSDSALSKEILMIQKENALPGLAAVCSGLLDDLDIVTDPSSYSKSVWNKLIRRKIHAKNRSDLLNRIRSYKKLEYSKFVEEEYGEQHYLKNMNVNSARTFFAFRAQMLRTVQMNFKGKREYADNEYKCICGEDDHQSHLTSCPSYSHLREGLDVEGSERDLVTYFQLVIREREMEGDAEV